jgi:16S rRNA (guanine(966)-N(2))-methyltransferase RsmD
VRIVSGKYKGRLIRPPKKINARPTTDFAKENLFNILETRIDFEDKKVLDLFSGTGNISYEFISRGAQSVLAIEKDFNHSRFIKQTASQMEMTNLMVKKGEVFKFLERCREQFDIIFADPPYQLKAINTLPDIIFSNKLLTKEGFFILEHSKHTDFSTHPNFYENRNYGNVNFSFFR